LFETLLDGCLRFGVSSLEKEMMKASWEDVEVLGGGRKVALVDFFDFFFFWPWVGSADEAIEAV